MLTPNFELNQTDKHVVLEIKAPLANVARTELVADDFNVFFSSPPYYLRLKLPGCVKESESESGTYDANDGVFVFKLDKVVAGQDFQDLDLIGKFLFTHKKYQARANIQLLDDAAPSVDSDDDEETFWMCQQPPPVPIDSSSPGYGFANKRTGNGEALREEFSEIVDLPDVDNTTIAQRGRLRESDEQSRFSDDHYLADFMEPSELKTIIEYKAPWDELVEQNNFDVKLTQEEADYLKTLGNRDYLLSPGEKKAALLSLADIVFAFAYNFRTFAGENTVESGWTINKLSPTLSWFQTYENTKEVKVACLRRSVVYPLYRHFELGLKLLDDTVKILKLGRRQILKCLIDVHKVFNASEPRYLLNQLYITDYCIWLQQVPDSKLASLAQHFEAAAVTKRDVRLELEELEQAALLVLQEDMEAVDAMMSKVSLNEHKSVREASSGTSDDDESSTADESDSEAS